MVLFHLGTIFVIFQQGHAMRKIQFIHFKSVAAVLLSSCSLQGLHAQSNNTWYGVFDVALRSQNNDSKQALDAGLIQGTRIGFRGDKSLVKEQKAIWNFEAGVSPLNGQSGQQGQLFGRQAWAGVEGSWGQIRAGRQFGVGFDMVGANDPYGIANASPIAWQFNLFGARFDNTLKYIGGNPNGFNYEAAVSYGGVAGASNLGKTIGAGVGHNWGNVSANIGTQQSTDINSNNQRSIFMGAKAQVLPELTLYGALVNVERDKGFSPCANINATPTAPCTANGPLANTNLAAGFTQGDAKTNYFQLGLKYKFNQNWEMVLGHMNDRTTIKTVSDKVYHRTTYAVLDYYLDKDFDIYSGLDFNAVSANNQGNSAYNLYGKSAKQSQTGFSVGMRYRF